MTRLYRDDCDESRSIIVIRHIRQSTLCLICFAQRVLGISGRIHQLRSHSSLADTWIAFISAQKIRYCCVDFV